MLKCKCGCGLEISNPSYNYKLKKYQEYIRGHNDSNRHKSRPQISGINNPMNNEEIRKKHYNRNYWK